MIVLFREWGACGSENERLTNSCYYAQEHEYCGVVLFFYHNLWREENARLTTLILGETDRGTKHKHHAVSPSLCLVRESLLGTTNMLE